jgi:small redox-active disulfide protein 2
MPLFQRKSKSKPCCPNCICSAPKQDTQSAVKVLGGGCKNCHKLMKNTQEALQTLGMDPQVELVSDPAAIAASGVMATPALIVDGQVVSTGRVLSIQQAADAIQGIRGTKR